MPISELLTRTCTITHRESSGITDDYGDAIPTEIAAETVCEVQQRSRSEPAMEGELSATDWLGVFPTGTLLATGDTVWVDGLGAMEMVGDPWPVRDPETGEESHLEATLRIAGGREEGS